MSFTASPPSRPRAYGQSDNTFKASVGKHWFYTLMVLLGTSIPLPRKPEVTALSCLVHPVSLPVMSGLQGHLSAFTFRRCDLSSFSQKTVAKGALAPEVRSIRPKGVVIAHFCDRFPAKKLTRRSETWVWVLKSYS